MNNKFNHTIRADQLEIKLQEAAEAIRANSERPGRIRAQIKNAVKERSKPIQLGPGSEEEEEEEEE